MRLEPLLKAGAVLRGTYEIVRQVGAGGMGEVYEARHVRLQGHFAIKVLCGRVTADSPALARFRREAEITSSLRHPNIVQVVDFHEGDGDFGAPYIVMEHLDGHDLAAELAARKSFPLPRVVSLVDQIASALAAAHGCGVVHRDLKPMNVFLQKVPEPDRDFAKVLDFGISKVRTSVSITNEPCLVGTPEYMSPEQAQSRTEEIDGRTDQFALAAMAWEMLTGRAAFQGENVPGVLFKITNEDPPPAASLAAGIPREVDAVLSRALAKEKEARFATVREFADALSRAAGPGALSRKLARSPSRTVGPGDSMESYNPRMRAERLTVAALGVLAGVGLAVLLFGRRGSKAPEVRTPPSERPAVGEARVAATPPPPAPQVVATSPPKSQKRSLDPRRRPSYVPAK